MSSAQCHGRLIAALARPMTLHEAQIEINAGVSGSSPAFVSLKQVFDAAMTLVQEGFITITDKRPPGQYDLTDSLHISIGGKPLLTFRATALGLSVVSEKETA